MTPIPPAALDQHIAILGKTGSGKTYAAKTIVERLLEQKRHVCVVDPTAAWFGLRLGSDGKSKGFDIVLIGGKHADIPLAERSGQAVARLVTGQRANVVLDTSGMTVGEYTRWFIDFASTLYTTIREPLHLVIDEAHYFMPQGGGGRLDVDAGRMLHAGNRLMSGGRSLGIRGLLITQRPAKLHKDALTCADTLVAMRMIAPQDRQAVKDWIDGAGDAVRGKEVLDSLAGLQRGEGWVWYPEGDYLKRVTFPRIGTYDSSATPKHGAKAAPSIAAIDLDEVRASMAEAVAEAEANDPKLLRKQIADLQKQLKERPETKIERQVERVDVPVLKNGQLDKAHKLVDRLEGIFSGTGDLVTSLKNAIGKVTKPAPVKAVSKPQALAPRTSVLAEERNCETSDATPQGGLRRMLIALAQRPQGMSARQLGVRAGLSSSSGTFGTYLGTGRSNGWIDGSRDRLGISDNGLKALGKYDLLPTGSELVNYWLGELGGGAARMLEVLVSVYPECLSADELGERAGMSAGSGTFGTYLGKLRTLELVSGGRGELRASDELFG